MPVGLLSHAQNAVRWLAVSIWQTEAPQIYPLSGGKSVSHVCIRCQKELSVADLLHQLLGRSHARSKQEGGLWKVYHILWECAKRKTSLHLKGFLRGHSRGVGHGSASLIKMAKVVTN